MVFFNYALRKLNAKIVYYGPGLCGKTTNLQWIHDHFEGGQRGKMISLATEGDRTIFFDLLPIDIGSIRGMDVTLQLYTVPGQVHYNSTRQLVLRGADGVVFVADSQRTMKSSNVESYENLQENLMLQGIDLKEFPHTLQFNKRDLRDLLSPEDLNESLNIFSVPIFEAIATEGIGVQETLEGIVKLVMRNLRDKYEPMAGAGGPKGPVPMKWEGPKATPPPPVAPPPAPRTPTFESDPAAVTAASAAPGALEEERSLSDLMDSIDADTAFPAFQDEDQIKTAVYEGTDDLGDAEIDSAVDAFESPSPAFAFDRVGDDAIPDAVVDPEPGFAEAPASVSPEPDEGSENLVTDLRDAAGSADLEGRAAVPESGAVEPQQRGELTTDPNIIEQELSRPRAVESVDDIFGADETAAEGHGAGVAVAPGFDAGAVPKPTVPVPPAPVVEPAGTDRYEDRIEAPGPFAPPPAPRPPVEPPLVEPPVFGADSQEMDAMVRQALGASEDREALASLKIDEDDLAFVPPVVEPLPPPPPVPPVQPPAPQASDTFEIPRRPAAEPAAKPAAAGTPVRKTVAPPPRAHDPLAKSQPIMVGSGGEPFVDASDQPKVVVPEIVIPAAAAMTGSRKIDVSAEDNQLHLKLKGSGAIAEMGQVRALDIEVPVPGQWVGNRKVTLQLRLTLIPAEIEND